MIRECSVYENIQLKKLYCKNLIIEIMIYNLVIFDLGGGWELLGVQTLTALTLTVWSFISSVILLWVKIIN